MYLNVVVNKAKINFLIETAGLISVMMVKKRQEICRHMHKFVLLNSKMWLNHDAQSLLSE